MLVAIVAARPPGYCVKSNRLFPGQSTEICNIQVAVLQNQAVSLLGG